MLLIGAMAFGLVLGFGILDPRNIAWMQVGDTPEYYLAWSFFRSSPPAWPPPLNPKYGIELSSTIFFADIVPLLALPLKAWIAPTGGAWQFHGAWLLACFLLQAVFAHRIASLFLRDPAERLILVAIITFSPALLWRLPGPHANAAHLSLCAQWLLLWAGWLGLRRPTPSQGAHWLALGAAASMVHPYLLAMGLAFWVADIVRRRISGGRSLALALEAAAMGCVVAASLWLAGFRRLDGAGLAEPGFGIFRANLLTLFDTHSAWSFIINGLTIHPGEYEGFAYLGTGGLLLLLAALWSVRREPIPRLPRAYWPFVVAIAALALGAVSNVVALGPLELVTIPLPGPVERFAAAFRSSGRMIWPLHYAVLFAAAVILARHATPRRGRSLLALALLLQVGDGAAGWLPIRRAAEVSGPAWPTPLHDPFWDQASARAERIRYVPTLNHPPPWRALSSLALAHGIETDAVYLARVPHGALVASRAAGLSMLETGRFEAGTLYVLHDAVACRALDVIDPSRDLLARIDGLNVLAPGWLGDRDWPASALPFRRAGEPQDVRQAILCTPDPAGRVLPVPREGD